MLTTSPTSAPTDTGPFSDQSIGPDLREMFELRKLFRARLYPNCGAGEETFEEFIALWTLMPTELRERAAHDYRRGFDQCVTDAVESLKKRAAEGGRIVP